MYWELNDFPKKIHMQKLITIITNLQSQQMIPAQEINVNRVLKV